MHKELVTNYGEGGGGGYKTGRGGGGASEVLPLRKVGGGGVLAMLKGGGQNKFWGSFNHTEGEGGGGCKSFRQCFTTSIVKSVLNLL